MADFSPRSAGRPLQLRALTAADLPALADRETEFDDFGPGRERVEVPPCRVEDDGTMAVVEDGALVGTVGWHWVQWGPNVASRCPMIGIWLAQSARGRGLGTQAQRLVVDLLFRHLPVNRVEAHTDVANLAEQRALERAGFTVEGVTRGAQWRIGRYHDGILYSILRQEWSAQGG